MTVLTGDCVEVMAAMDPDSIDAIVTDPPYAIGFMSKPWDIQHDHEPWSRAAIRVAKPGAYLLAFGGTRTVHRLTVALEDAGWTIRDVLCWVYASGFPKSKSSLKPAWEPIVLARKPGPLRELAIDACRIGTGEGGDRDGEPTASTRYGSNGVGFQPMPGPRGGDAAGRWPANVVLTDPAFDGGWDGVVGGGVSDGFAGGGTRGAGFRSEYVNGTRRDTDLPAQTYGDTGTYSRFFLVPKASRSDREPLVPGDLPLGMPDNAIDRVEQRERGTGRGSRSGPRRNVHPTVKPTALMRHLVRLVTPQGGTVLNPFLGSGSTAKAAVLEGFAFVGIEREAEYARIVEQRLVELQQGLGL